MNYIIWFVVITANGEAVDFMPNPAEKPLDLQRCIKSLEDARTTEARVDAIRVIAKFSKEGKPAIPALTRALQDPSPDVRGAAVRALQRIVQNEEGPITALIATLRLDAQPSVRFRAANALGTILCFNVNKNPKMPIWELLVSGLIQASTDSDPSVRTYVVRALIGTGGKHPGAVGTVLRCLKDSAPEVRDESASTLGSFARTDNLPPEAVYVVPDLIPFLQSSNPSTREYGSSSWSLRSQGQRCGHASRFPTPRS